MAFVSSSRCMPRPKRKYMVNIPAEKKATISTRSRLFPDVESTDAAKKTRIPSRQGLNPATSPAPKTADMLYAEICSRSISECEMAWAALPLWFSGWLGRPMEGGTGGL
ncbi:MAG: hypothetical protein BWY13_00818 [Euryarchaeota archaeon ADurb.Bin190]|nr:MAG: hypothetical protein BWY13_00818 [Euryarchaeota archaeon ADurb.Bin190]